MTRRETGLQRERKSFNPRRFYSTWQLPSKPTRARIASRNCARCEAQSLVGLHAPLPKHDHWCTLLPARGALIVCTFRHASQCRDLLRAYIESIDTLLCEALKMVVRRWSFGGGGGGNLRFFFFFFGGGGVTGNLTLKMWGGGYR